MEKRIWQKLGKRTLPQERIVDINGGRKTLLFIREKMMVTLETIKKEFGISTECARLRTYRLQKSGFISKRLLKGKPVYFCTKLGFSKMPREKGIGKKQGAEKIIEKIEILKKEKEVDRVYPFKRI